MSWFTITLVESLLWLAVVPVVVFLAAGIAAGAARRQLAHSRHIAGVWGGLLLARAAWPVATVVAAVWLAATANSFWGQPAWSSYITAISIGAAVVALGSAVVSSTVSTLHRGQSGRPYALWGVIAQLLVIAVGALLVLTNLGYDVRALLGGLGLGGVAVALAVKDTLTDAFGSIAIQTGNMFAIGDDITVSGQRGRVLQIGLKNTRLQGELGEIIVPNSALTGSVVINHSRQHGA